MKNKHRNVSKKSRRNFHWLFLGVLAAFIFIFRSSIAFQTIDFVVKSLLPVSDKHLLQYEYVGWEKGRFVVTGLDLQEEQYNVKIDRLEIGCSIDFFKFYIEPQLSCTHPQVILKKIESKHTSAVSFGALVPTRFHSVKIDMQSGVLQLAQQNEVEELYFCLMSGKGKEKMGSFSLSYDPSSFQLPVVLGQWEVRDKELISEIRIQAAECSRLIQLAGFFYPSLDKGWENIHGEIDIKSKATFTLPFSLNQLSCQLDVDHLALVNSVLGIHAAAENFHGEFSYPANPLMEVKKRGMAQQSFWKQVVAAASLKNAEFAGLKNSLEKEIGLNISDAHLLLLPESDPSLSLKGEVLCNGVKSPISLEGKGHVNEDQTFWLEVGMELAEEKKASMEALFSICSLQKHSYVIESDVKNVDSTRVKFLQEILGCAFPQLLDLQMQKGMLQAKMTTWLEDGKVSKLSIEELTGKEVDFFFPRELLKGFIQEFRLEADLDFSQDDRLTRLVADVKKAEIDINGENNSLWSASNIETRLVVREGVMHPSWIRGTVLGGKGEVVFCGPGKPADIKISFSSNTQNLLNKLFGNQQEMDQSVAFELSSEVKKEAEKFILNGEMSFGNTQEKIEHVAFGCDVAAFSLNSSETFFEALKTLQGWLRSEKISPKIYLPFLRGVSQEIQADGDLDLIGTFDSSLIEVSLQTNQLEFRHPLLDLHLGSLGQKDPMLLNLDGRATVKYDFKERRWQGIIPLESATIWQKDFGIAFENVKGLCRIDGDSMCIEEATAESCGLHFEGRIDGNFEGSQAGDIKITSSKIIGPASGLVQFLEHFPSLPSIPLPHQGEIFIGDQGFEWLCHLCEEGTDAHWRVDAQLNQLCFDINSDVRVAEFGCRLNYDSLNQELLLKDINGQVLNSAGKRYLLYGKKFIFNHAVLPEFQFDLSLKEGGVELLKVTASAKQEENDEIYFFLDTKQTHFFGTRFDLSNLKLKSWSMLDCIEGHAHLNLETLPKQLQFLTDNGIVLSAGALEKEITKWQPQGLLDLHFKYEETTKKLNFDATSSNLILKDKSINSFALKGEKIADGWVIEKLQIDDLLIKTSILNQEGTLIFPQVELFWNKAYLKAQGMWLNKDQQLHLSAIGCKVDIDALCRHFSIAPSPLLLTTLISEGQLRIDFPQGKDPWAMQAQLSVIFEGDETLKIQNQGKLQVDFSSAGGLKIKGLDLIAKESSSDILFAECIADEIFYHLPSQKWEGKKLHFIGNRPLFSRLADFKSVLSFLAEDSLDAWFEFESDSSSFQIKGSLKEGAYKVGDSIWDFKQVGFRIDPKLFTIWGRSEHFEDPLFLSAQWENAIHPKGILTLQAHPKASGLKVYFKMLDLSGFEIEGVQGELWGLEANFVKASTNGKENENQSQLSGNLNVNLTELVKFFPNDLKENLKGMNIGDGYALEGNLILDPGNLLPFHFSGQLKGRNFECMGYQLDRMEAQIEITPHRVLVHHLTIEDESGLIAIKQGKMSKDHAMRRWLLDIPLIQAHEFKPSLLKKKDQVRGTIKPLTIKHCSFSHIRGYLDDYTSWRGEGELNFTNALKKEFHFLDIPLDLIKNFGLDPGMFTPVYGEIDCKLLDGRIYLTELHNVYSEGKRSEFFLASNEMLGFIDLKGRLHIDVKMKQNVVLKLTEPFILTVRGTLEKPFYGLMK